MTIPITNRAIRQSWMMVVKAMVRMVMLMMTMVSPMNEDDDADKKLPYQTVTDDV